MSKQDEETGSFVTRFSEAEEKLSVVIDKFQRLRQAHEANVIAGLGGRREVKELGQLVSIYADAFKRLREVLDNGVLGSRVPWYVNLYARVRRTFRGR